MMEVGDPVVIELPTSEWFCQRHREVSPGILGMAGNLACERAIRNVLESDERFLVLNANTVALAPVEPDGRSLIVQGSVAHRGGCRIQAAAEPGEILVSSAVRELATGSGVNLLERGHHQLRALDDSYTRYAVADDRP